MLDTLSPSEPRLQRAQGIGRIVGKPLDGRTGLDTLYQDGCAKIRVPKGPGGALHAVLINSSGGLTGGDRVDWSVEARTDTHLVVTTQACERVYRSLGGAAAIETTIRVEAGARVDWLPQETILFDGGALARTLKVDLDAEATFLGLEAVILGREAMGETAFSAALADIWRVRRAGALIHAEASRLNAENMLERGNPALLDGARAFATLLYVGADAGRRLEPMRARLAAHPTAGISRIGEKLVLRALARSGYHLRAIMVPLIAALSAGGTVPRLWTL